MIEGIQSDVEGEFSTHGKCLPEDRPRVIHYSRQIFSTRSWLHSRLVESFPSRPASQHEYGGLVRYGTSSMSWVWCIVRHNLELCSLVTLSHGNLSWRRRADWPYYIVTNVDWTFPFMAVTFSFAIYLTYPGKLLIYQTRNLYLSQTNFTCTIGCCWNVRRLGVGKMERSAPRRPIKYNLGCMHVWRFKGQILESKE